MHSTENVIEFLGTRATVRAAAHIWWVSFGRNYSTSPTLCLVTANTELKWRIDNPDSDYTCECDDDCEHSIKTEEFDQLKEGLMVNALWPFNGNHYYPARIVRVFLWSNRDFSFCLRQPIQSFSPTYALVSEWNTAEQNVTGSDEDHRWKTAVDAQW